MMLFLAIAALVLALVTLVQSKGQSVVGWALVCLALIHCLPIFP